MKKPNYEALVKKHLHRIAPEADLDALKQDDDLGSTLDIDSMDFYRVMVAISEDLDIEIPEEQYGELRTVQNIVAFLETAAP